MCSSDLNKGMYTKAFYNKAYDNPNSFGATYGEHRDALEFGESEYKELKAFAAEIGITMFSTAFDVASADFLAKLDMPAYKIASGDLNNIPLIRHVARIGKPMIISTGGASMDEVRRAYDVIMQINPQLCIMQCTSGYPCVFEEMNLKVISTYRQEFPDAIIGLSAHDSGIAMAVAAYTLGGRMVEKHFTLNRAMKGTDHAFSLEKPGLQKLVRDLNRVQVAMGDGIKRTYESEKGPLMKMGKKLVAARNLPAGHVISWDDVAVKSPGDGLAPYELDVILGAVTTTAIKEDENFTWEALKLRDPSKRTAQRTSHLSVVDRIRRVRLVAFDFDGVFTDDRVHVSSENVESVICHRGDGLGLRSLERAGVATLILSTETNAVVALRARKLQVRCISGCHDKKTALEGVAREMGLTLDQVAFVGNDVNDAGCLEAVGLPVAVSNAHPDVHHLAAVTTKTPGGHGAVREKIGRAHV